MKTKIEMRKHNKSPAIVEYLIPKVLIGVGYEYIQFTLTEEQAIQFGQLSIDISTKENIPELSMTIGDNKEENEKEIK